MVIQHNISSLNAWRNTKINNGSTAKNLEKLSSGLKVNRSADDAAGLAISEKMRGQIRGLAMAEMNVKHGVNLIKTAEGGMEEIGNMLQRQRELIVQSLNGTYIDEDRELLQREIDQLTKSIDGISKSTHFNGIQLLNVPPLEPVPVVGPSLPPLDTSNHYTSLSTETPVNGSGRLNLNATNSLNEECGLIYSGGGETTSFNFSKIRLSGGTSTVDISLTDLTVNNDYSMDGHMTFGSTTPLGVGVWESTFTYNQNGYDILLTQTVSIVETTTLVSGVPLKSAYFDISYDIKNNGGGNITASFMHHLDTEFTLPGGIRNDDPAFSLNGTKVALTRDTSFTGSNIPNTVDLWDGRPPEQNPITNLNARIIVNGAGITNSPDELRIGTFSEIDDFDHNFNSNTSIGDSGYAVLWNNRTIAAGGTLSMNTMYGVTDPRINPELGSVDGVAAMRSTDLYIHNGANKDENVRINRYDCRPATLGVNNVATKPREAANQSLLDLDKAINTIGTYRATCGAQQNRLEHSLNNLGVSKENLQAAESTIRDVDMAKEMMHFTKNNILVQASQSMLAQANQLPQGVLSMLK